MSDPVMENLPPSIREMAGHIGLQGALSIVQAYFGRTLKVPVSEREGSTYRHLVEILGPDAAAIFLDVYRGERLGVPRCAAALRAARDNEIIERYNDGWSVTRLVDEYRMTERHIRTILNRVPGAGVSFGGASADDRQMGLF